ncbi:MAG: hypothetical protein HN979_04870 [Actinobacteria bacterium]|nr:hypothetical protein [Actinomycetota bacterium]MBT3687687.1 hypothetical protein [Actinomycetota bacterium]MBT4036949.1 hypothetical protein [Actinomycetota bacterium]MBT4279198.1 hypothetical protein [Actinomycetota bacterium]MBT4344096.1 hypothetical protein [Actinomycetota bacterium]
MYFVVYNVDRSDAGNLRADTRAGHLDYVNGYEVVFGGPLVDPEGEMCGSLIVVDLPSHDAAVAFAAGDPYALAGLFEQSSVTAFRQVMGPA